MGVTLPFVPAYLSSLGITDTQVGLLLAVGPAFAIIGPPVWGQVTDRLGRPGLVLLILLSGTLGGYGLLQGASTFWQALGALAVQASFSTSITTVVDSLALQHVLTTGGSYARIRAWGSFGFVVSTLSFGFWVTTIDRRMVWVAMALMCLCALWTAFTLARAPTVRRLGPKPTVEAALALLERKEVALFLLATTLHWVACAPYHGILTLHLKALGHPPSTVSLSSSVAVAAELLVLVSYGRWAARVPVPTMLALSFGASALRWWGVASTDSAPLLIALSLLHGLTFGTFYVASVAWVSARTPDSLRATGQALFVAATFGVGGLVGFVLSGRVFELLGGHQLFALAGALELLPVAVVLLTASSARTRA